LALRLFLSIFSSLLSSSSSFFLLPASSVDG